MSGGSTAVAGSPAKPAVTAGDQPAQLDAAPESTQDHA